MKNSSFVKVSDVLNNPLNNPNIIPDASGVYRWYASEEKIKQFLDFKILDFKLLGFDFVHDIFDRYKNQKDGNGEDMFLKHSTGNDRVLYAFYVGSAKSLQSRIVNNHINGKGHSELRTTISALNNSGATKDAVSTFMNDMVVEYELVPESEMKDEERRVINRHLSILNSKDNHREELKNYVIWLTPLRAYAGIQGRRKSRP